MFQLSLLRFKLRAPNLYGPAEWGQGGGSQWMTHRLQTKTVSMSMHSRMSCTVPEISRLRYSDPPNNVNQHFLDLFTELRLKTGQFGNWPIWQPALVANSLYCVHQETFRISWPGERKALPNFFWRDTRIYLLDLTPVCPSPSTSKFIGNQN